MFTHTIMRCFFSLIDFKTAKPFFIPLYTITGEYSWYCLYTLYTCSARFLLLHRAITMWSNPLSKSDLRIVIALAAIALSASSVEYFVI